MGRFEKLAEDIQLTFPEEEEMQRQINNVIDEYGYVNVFKYVMGYASSYMMRDAPDVDMAGVEIDGDQP